MAEVIAIGEAVNEEERKAIAWLRDHLPDNYYIIHNFEVEQYDTAFEVDLCIIAPHALYVVDAKGVHGRVDVIGSEWQPEGRAAYRSPMPKLRGNAKSLSGLIARQNRSNRDLKNIYIDTAVLLTIDSCDFHDPDNRERGHIIKLKESTRFFTDASRIPERFSRSVLRYKNIIATALGKVAKKPQHGLRLGSWEVAEKLQVKEGFTEYRGFNIATGKKSGTVLVRAYHADPYLEKEQREKQQRLLENSHRALMKLPSHSAIVNAKDFFSTEANDKFVLITEDIPSETLANHIKNTELALTLDQKKRVVQDILSALAHCHFYQVIHRNISPEHILMGLDGQPRLTDFDYAKVGLEQTTTIADQIQQRVEARYKAPELWADENAASPASDLYSFALVIYELFTGLDAFSSATQAIEQSAVFDRAVSAIDKQIPASFDTWLDQLKTIDPDERLSAKQALEAFDMLWQPPVEKVAVIEKAEPKPETTPESIAEIDYKHLKAGFELTNKYVIQEPLGKPGGFGIVYKVVDTYGDVTRAIKLILQDRESVLERLKLEYKTLIKLPEHDNVVKVFDADVLANNGPPYIVFEYLQGHDVGVLVKEQTLSLFEVWQMTKQVAEGLAHLHEHNVFHCDIKPQNLIWKDGKVKIIDFNVSVDAEDLSHGGGSRKYLPPDLDISTSPQTIDLIDRDLYALGITIYRAMTGEYPWAKAQMPPVDTPAQNPINFARCIDLSDSVSALLLKMIAPKRGDRFESAEQLLVALKKVRQLKKRLRQNNETTTQFHLPALADGSDPSKNAFHDYLLTLYSQSRYSNSGTRGLDEYAKLIYVDTALDTQLAPAIMSGELRLVLITGNAGDGKTAFLQQLEALAIRRGVSVEQNPEGNGCHFEIDGHRYVSNYDGSQDEGDIDNDQVLQSFFTPYNGNEQTHWPLHETRLIAINEGRLIDFLTTHQGEFYALKAIVDEGLQQSEVNSQIAVVNLNLRDVLADSETNTSIFERLIARMVKPNVWQGCGSCKLKDKCYVRYNITTFQNKDVGSKVIERLKHLYSLTNLRNQLHITLRDLRSALGYMLVGQYSCSEIREIYASGEADKILQGYYYNAWCGKADTEDRLLKLLQEVDIGRSSNVRLDRRLDFLGVDHLDAFSFEDRSDYDQQLFNKLHNELPETDLIKSSHYQQHQHYVAMLRRKSFFEIRGEDWRNMVLYRSAQNLVDLLKSPDNLDAIKQKLIYAMNRGEGLHRPDFFKGQLAMQVRRVANGTIKSFRVFPADVFNIEVKDAAINARFIEHQASRLLLSYQGEGGLTAELDLNLDLFEMLERLYEGYIPSLEELQGYYLSLSVFKNVLASAPYQEVLLTEDGHQYRSIKREEDGSLVLQGLDKLDSRAEV